MITTLFISAGLSVLMMPGQMLVAADSTDIPWVKYADFNGGFSILAPQALEEKIDTISTDLGAIAYHTLFYAPNDESADNLVYMVSYCDYPESTFPKDSTELISNFFDATIEEAAASVNGKVVYSADIKINDFPGRIWRIHYLNEKAMIKTKAFLVNNRYFAVQVVTWRDKSLNHVADRFLDSFQLFSP